MHFWFRHVISLINNSASGANNPPHGVAWMCRCRDAAKRSINTGRFVCRGIFGVFSLLCLSTFRQFPAVVRMYTHIFNITSVWRFSSRASSHLILYSTGTATLSSTSLDALNSDLLIRPSPSQCSRRDPACSSKAPSIHASNCRQKANVSRTRVDQSGRGTYHVSPTWAVCSLVRNCSTATFQTGTCQGWRTCVVCSWVRHLSTVISRSGMYRV